MAGRVGRISLATDAYPGGTWLSGETVDVVIPYGRLLEIFHLAVRPAAFSLMNGFGTLQESFVY